MRKLIVIGIIGLAIAAAPAAAGPTTVKVVMHDPGCHWFAVGSKYVKSVSRHGAVTLVNTDEAALVIKGPGGTKHEAVLGKLTLRAKGTYRITMVHQARDDNHLTLRIS